jgi:hypothetical protein
MIGGCEGFPEECSTHREARCLQQRHRFSALALPPVFDCCREPFKHRLGSRGDLHLLSTFGQGISGEIHNCHRAVSCTDIRCRNHPRGGVERHQGRWPAAGGGRVTDSGNETGLYQLVNARRDGGAGKTSSCRQFRTRARLPSLSICKRSLAPHPGACP